MRYQNDTVNPHDAYLISLYERSQRDPVSSAVPTRADVPMGKWTRFHPGQELIWIDDMEGRPRALTPKQYAVLTLALAMADTQMLTMREMAARLSVAPSTVSRALAKLSAWGVLAYIVGRGRFAGLVIIRRVKGDGWDHLREAAKRRIRGWAEAAQRRVLRLQINVASIYPWKVIEDHGLGNHYVDGMNATLSRPWTVEDMAELDRDLGNA